MNGPHAHYHSLSTGVSALAVTPVPCKAPSEGAVASLGVARREAA